MQLPMYQSHTSLKHAPAQRQPSTNAHEAKCSGISQPRSRTSASRDHVSRHRARCHMRLRQKRKGLSASSTRAQPPQSDCETIQTTEFWETVFKTLQQPYSTDPAVRQSASDVARKINTGIILHVTSRLYEMSGMMRSQCGPPSHLSTVCCNYMQHSCCRQRNFPRPVVRICGHR